MLGKPLLIRVLTSIERWDIMFQTQRNRIVVIVCAYKTFFSCGSSMFERGEIGDQRSHSDVTPS